ncbi:hypothetical protein Krac_1877 [Ktedonobacter racemifer DSM 44963]|uniref:Uncharacterized protein n=1 Tax=Ktedonobacter racemifer DSM 44963 TaxID=485913 RepID=D6U3U0_KTERA|nr:hypothetical protein Krac_1877 [Ktedonobacter racemifer DSM 44963]
MPVPKKKPTTLFSDGRVRGVLREKEVRIGRGAAAVECAGEACAKRGERNGMWGSCSPMTIACGVLPGERLLSLPWSPIVMVAPAEVGGPGRVLP